MTGRLLLALTLFCTLSGNAQDDFRVLSRWLQYAEASDALVRHVSAEALQQVAARKKLMDAVQTAGEWRERQAWIRQALSKAVGSFPERTPMNPQITGIVEKKDFRVENIVYESMPGYYVTASLFIPAGLKRKKAPAIIYCSGHTLVGYRGYQQVILNLVKKGFVVFAFDPVGQGERIEYTGQSKEDKIAISPTQQHSYPGAQYFLNGQSIARNFIWDGIRAIDYISSRKEVDTTRIGISGRSGGGTQSSYIAAFDDRITAVAPENYITSYTALLLSIGLQDAEQNFVSGIKQGLDMADLLTVQAPRPTLMITTSRDIFAIEGSDETALEVQRAYSALGAPQHFATATDNDGHASTKKNREALYAFFQKVFAMPGVATDETVEMLTPEELRVTKTGQVSTSYAGLSSFDLNKKYATQKIISLFDKREKTSFVKEMLTAARQLSGYHLQKGIPVFMGAFEKGYYTIEKYRLELEKDYVIPYLLYRPKQIQEKAVLYLHPEGKIADTAANGEMMQLVKQGITVLAPDLPGVGELGNGKFKGDSFIGNIAYNTWFTTVMTGTSIAGIQASDISTLAAILQQDGAKEVYGIARSGLCAALLHAAAFDSSIKRVALLQPYASYRSFVENKYYQPSFLYGTVAGAIGNYDLPDLAASLAPRPLLIVNPTDANGSQEDRGITVDFYLIKKGYDNMRSLQISQNASKDEIWQLLSNWLR